MVIIIKSSLCKHINKHIILGIHVDSDGMPQSICAICYDKINDFYEFRLMSLNTEQQTRKALGLPEPAPTPQQPKNHPKPSENKEPVVKLVDLKYSIQDKILIRKAFEKLSNRNTAKERRSETPPAAAAAAPPPTKKPRKDHLHCFVCSQYFAYLTDLHDHQIKEHVPSISKYACGSCRLTFEQLADYKAHENSHTKDKLPFECFSCLCSFSKIKEFLK